MRSSGEVKAKVRAAFGTCLLLALAACSSAGQPEPVTAPDVVRTVTETVTAAPSPTSEPSADTVGSSSASVIAVMTEPDGLFCRDLRAAGYDFAASVEYWRYHGQPSRMDADRNGIPCETVFSASEVARYYHAAWRGLLDATPGLFCRDLKAAGASFSAAVGYWLSEGMPNRMDADRNGVPCETVYSFAERFRFYGPSDAFPDVGLGPGWLTTLDPPPLTRDLGPGFGSTVVCGDGAISHAGGRSGACSHHGGVR